MKTLALIFVLTFGIVTAKAAPNNEKQYDAKNMEGANAPKDSSSIPLSKKQEASAKNVKGRNGKVPTESSKNAQPSQLKTQERTETVE